MGWQETLAEEQRQGGLRFSFEWYRNHTITKQLLQSGLVRGEVCDVACGIGRRAIVLSQATKTQVVGIDADVWAIQKALNDASELNSPAQFQVGSFYDLPVESGKFDTVLFIAAIEHAAFPVHALRELCRITKNGGTILISTTLNDFHADSDHKSSFSLAGLTQLLTAFGKVDTWIEDNIIYASISPSPRPLITNSDLRVIYADMRHPDTYTELWDDAISSRSTMVPISFGIDGNFLPHEEDKLMHAIEDADVLHIGTGALALKRQHLEAIRYRRPELHISKWWGDVCPDRYQSECSDLSDLYNTIFLSVSNYIGNCNPSCTQIHLNSPGAQRNPQSSIEFWSRPWDVGLFANAYSNNRLERMREYLPKNRCSSIWYGDGSPLGRISRSASNQLIGLCRINLNIVDPAHQHYRHWFSARVSNALANGCIVVSSEIDGINSVLGHHIVTASDNPSSWHHSIDSIITLTDRLEASTYSQQAIKFYERFLTYRSAVDTLFAAWGKTID